MTARARSSGTGSMVLPYADPVFGEVSRWASVGDVRVPGSWVLERPARVFGQSLRSVACPAGRHLWDVLVADGAARDDVHDLSGSGGDPDGEWRAVRLRLTCVRCGVVQQFVGLEDCSARVSVGAVEPRPVRVSGLLAQQVRPGHGSGEGRWEVFVEAAVRAAEPGMVRPVAVVESVRGRRGGCSYIGRLVVPDGATSSAARLAGGSAGAAGGEWSSAGGETVEAATVAGCVRGLGRLLERDGEGAGSDAAGLAREAERVRGSGKQRAAECRGSDLGVPDSGDSGPGCPGRVGSVRAAGRTS